MLDCLLASLATWLEKLSVALKFSATRWEKLIVSSYWAQKTALMLLPFGKTRVLQPAILKSGCVMENG
jgi:hypothetical protein